MESNKEKVKHDLTEESLENNENECDGLGDAYGSIDPEENLISKITTESNYYTDDTLSETMKNNKGLSIVQFNARSLNANFSNIDAYISSLSFKFDIITISETWFSEHTNINIFNIEGYNMLYVSRNGGKGGGVAIYINSEFRYNKLESKCVCIDDCFECITVELLFNGSKNVIIACLYRKPGSQIDEFTSKLEELFGNLKKKQGFIHLW